MSFLGLTTHQTGYWKPLFCFLGVWFLPGPPILVCFSFTVPWTYAWSCIQSMHKELAAEWQGGRCRLSTQDVGGSCGPGRWHLGEAFPGAHRQRLLADVPKHPYQELHSLVSKCVLSDISIATLALCCFHLHELSFSFLYFQPVHVFKSEVGLL